MSFKATVILFAAFAILVSGCSGNLSGGQQESSGATNTSAAIPSANPGLPPAMATPIPTPTPTPIPPPATPSNLIATCISQSAVTLTWAPVTGATSYVIESMPTHATTGGFVQLADVTSPTYTNSSLNYTWQYTYVVFAIGSTGYSAPSEQVTIQVLTAGTAASASSTPQVSATPVPPVP